MQDGTAVIDIAYEFERIFSRNIITIAFGEDVSDEKFEIMVSKEDDPSFLVPKAVSMREALKFTIEKLIEVFPAKIKSPSNFGWEKRGFMYPITEYDK